VYMCPFSPKILAPGSNLKANLRASIYEHGIVANLKKQGLSPPSLWARKAKKLIGGSENRLRS